MSTPERLACASARHPWRTLAVWILGLAAAAVCTRAFLPGALTTQSSFAHTGGIITGAALIMVAVFGGVALGKLTMMQQMGFGLGVAVLLDATVVRCLLVPALMVMVGKANWYLPRWVDRWLPHISIEGAEFFAARDRRAAVPSEAVGAGSARGE